MCAHINTDANSIVRSIEDSKLRTICSSYCQSYTKIPPFITTYMPTVQPTFKISFSTANIATF